MKLSMWCICIAGTLLISTMASGSIGTDGDWDGDEYGGGDVSGDWEYTGAYARASGSEPTSWAGGEGWQEEYTTEAGQFEYYYTAYVYTEVQLTLYNNQYTAGTAYASATASGPGNPLSYSASTQLGGSGVGGEPLFAKDGPYTNYQNGTANFDAYESVGGTSYAVAGASAPSGGSCRANAHAFAEGWGSLSD